VVADNLSRPAAAVTPATRSEAMDWHVLAAAQEAENVHQQLSSSSLQLQVVDLGGARVLCDVATGVWRLVLVGEFRYQAYVQVHELSHAGVRATSRMLAACFVWPGLARDAKEWCRQCTRCANTKTTLQEKTKVEKMGILQARFSHVHLDLVGPLPQTARGNRYLLTADSYRQVHKVARSCPHQRD